MADRSRRDQQNKSCWWDFYSSMRFLLSRNIFCGWQEKEHVLVPLPQFISCERRIIDIHFALERRHVRNDKTTPPLWRRTRYINHLCRLFATREKKMRCIVVRFYERDASFPPRFISPNHVHYACSVHPFCALLFPTMRFDPCYISYLDNHGAYSSLVTLSGMRFDACYITYFHDM